MAQLPLENAINRLINEQMKAQHINACDSDAVLAVMHPDVEWANGMEGGYVHGNEAVRDYWTRQ